MKYLNQSVQSVLNQQHSEFEFLILDDCSTDGSWAYILSLNDDRVKVWQNEQNRGLFYNLNYLIKKSKGNLIKLWSQDDIMQQDCLHEILLFHGRYPQIGFSYTDRLYIDANGKGLDINKLDTTPELISTELHTQIAFITGSIAGNIANVTLNKNALDSVGLFNENMKISGDFEMWVRMAKNYPVGFLKKQLVYLRNHKDQLSGQEQFFIYHLKEDIETYNLLFGYITTVNQAKGRIVLRKTKLLFYYTLMLKAFFKGKFSTGFHFLKLLNSLDIFYLITWGFLKAKFLFIK